MKTIVKKQIVVLTAGALASLASVSAFAQSSVTLYGIVDSSYTYQSSQTALGSTAGGRSNNKLSSGAWAGSRFGLKGTEDLGSGLAAIFQLESGFNINTGAQQYTNAMFGRQAWVGLTQKQYGTLTFGRQYTSYYTLLSAYSPTTWLTGFSGAHPGDLDGLDTTYRANNSIVYTTPNIYGFTASGTYSLGGIAGSVNQGSTWAGALKYTYGPFGIAAGITRVNNAAEGGGAYSANSTTTSGGEVGVSAVTNGYQNAQAQQRVAVGAGYQITPTVDVTATYSNVQYIPGINSGFASTVVFNTAGAVLHWKAMPALDLAAGYSYTRAAKANGISSGAQYQQISLGEYYSLSKRTGIYAIQAFQRANGQTLRLNANGTTSVISATAAVGDGFQTAPSSSRSQIVAGVGMIVRF